MLREAARMLVRLGMVLLVLAVLIRPATHGAANLAGDDLAIATSVAVVIAAAAYARLARQQPEPPADADEPRA